MKYPYNDIINDADEMEVCIKDKCIKGLFTNARIDKTTLPVDEYAYDLREGDNGDFCTIEPNVGVNHGGTFICNEEIIFPDRGVNQDKYFSFSEEDNCDYSFI